MPLHWGNSPDPKLPEFPLPVGKISSPRQQDKGKIKGKNSPAASRTIENWTKWSKINFPLRFSYGKAKNFLKNFLPDLIFSPNAQNFAGSS